MGDSLIVPDNQVVGLVIVFAKTVPTLDFEKSIGANQNINVSFVKDIKLVRYESDFEGVDSKLHLFLAKVMIKSADQPLTAQFTEFVVAIMIFDRENPAGGESTWIGNGIILQFVWTASEGIIQDAVFETIYDEKVDI